MLASSGRNYLHYALFDQSGCLFIDLLLGRSGPNLSCMRS